MFYSKIQEIFIRYNFSDQSSFVSANPLYKRVRISVFFSITKLLQSSKKPVLYLVQKMY